MGGASLVSEQCQWVHAGVCSLRPMHWAGPLECQFQFFSPGPASRECTRCRPRARPQLRGSSIFVLRLLWTAFDVESSHTHAHTHTHTHSPTHTRSFTHTLTHTQLADLVARSLASSQCTLSFKFYFFFLDSPSEQIILHQWNDFPSVTWPAPRTNGSEAGFFRGRFCFVEVGSKQETRSKKGLFYFSCSLSPNFFFSRRGIFRRNIFVFWRQKILKKQNGGRSKVRFLAFGLKNRKFLDSNLFFSFLTQILSGSNPQKLVFLLF